MIRLARLSSWAPLAAASALTILACGGGGGGAAAPSPSPTPTPTAPSAPAAATSGMRSSTTGVYTAAQATEGNTLWTGRCATCHTAASIALGTDFKTNWQGKPMWDVFRSIRNTMPQDNPGSLTANEYVQALAYLLQVGRQPAGSTALPTDSVGLKAIRYDTVGTRLSPRPSPRPR